MREKEKYQEGNKYKLSDLMKLDPESLPSSKRNVVESMRELCLPLDDSLDGGLAKQVAELQDSLAIDGGLAKLVAELQDSLGAIGGVAGRFEELLEGYLIQDGLVSSQIEGLREAFSPEISGITAKLFETFKSRSEGEIFNGYIYRILNSLQVTESDGASAAGEEKILEGFRKAYEEFCDTSPESDDTGISFASFRLGVYVGLLSTAVGARILDTFCDRLVEHADLVNEINEGRIKSEQGKKNRTGITKKKDALMEGLISAFNKQGGGVLTEGQLDQWLKSLPDDGYETGVKACPEIRVERKDGRRLLAFDWKAGPHKPAKEGRITLRTYRCDYYPEIKKRMEKALSSKK